jgi:hypothetical protein
MLLLIAKSFKVVRMKYSRCQTYHSLNRITDATRMKPLVAASQRRMLRHLRVSEF